MTLSKSISIFTFLFFINTISYGQFFGLKGSVGFPRFVAEHETVGSFNHQNKNVNLDFALIADYEINDRFTVMSALNLSRKSVTAKNGYTISYQLTYVEVPFLVKYFPKLKFNKIEHLKLYGLAGPYSSLGVKGTFRFNSANSNNVWSDGKDNFRLKRIDYGFIYGVGVYYKALQVELIHSLGLRNLSNSFEGLVSARNRNVGISVVVFFIKDRTDY